MNLRIKKRISAKIHSLIVRLKLLFFKKNEVYMNHSLVELLKEYKEKKKIVVFCSGPSGKKVTIDNDYLYLVTNDGYKRMLNEVVDYLLYLNDQYCVRRILAGNSVYRNDQKIIFYYSDSTLHNQGWSYLEDKTHLLDKLSLFFILNNIDYPVAQENFITFENFYKQKKLEIKIQNSGMFLLLFGYYLADMLKLPLEIYGLDLGVGGSVYFNSNTSPGKSVTRDRVKVNVKMYLDHIYQNHFDVKNFSNFHGNQIDTFER